MLLFVFAHFGHHLLIALLVPLLPFIRNEFALDYAQAGWVVSACTLSYGVGQLPAGWLADRIGPRIIITIGISGVALFGFLVGMAPSYILMAVFLMLMGILGGGYHPASVPVISTFVEPQNQGQALGIHQLGGTASYFLAPLIAVGVATALGWRGAFIGVAIPIMIFGIIFYVLLGRRGYTGKANLITTESHTKATSTPRHLSPVVAFLILSIFGQALAESTISFTPLFAIDQFGAGEEVGGFMLSLAYSAGFWAGPLGGYLSDRWGSATVMLGASLAAGPLIYLLNLTSYNWSIYAVLLIIGTFMYLRMPVAESYIISHTSEHNRSTMLGIYYSGSRGGIGAIMPALGYLIDRVGFPIGFTVVAAIQILVTLVCAIFLWKNRG